MTIHDLSQLPANVTLTNPTTSGLGLNLSTYTDYPVVLLPNDTLTYKVSTSVDLAYAYHIASVYSLNIDVEVVTPTYLVTFNVTPSDGITIKVDNKEISGNTTQLAAGSHSYEISASGYQTKSGNVKVTDGPVTETVTLDPVEA